MKTFFLFLVCAAAISANVRSAEANDHWTKPYNIVWTQPGTRGYDSMPAGAGNLSLNVWSQSDAVLFYIGSTDSFNADEGLTKLARVRIAISPNPFADRLRQELDLKTNTILVSGRTADGADVSLRIRADAHQPVVHVEGASTKPVSVTATLELDDAWSVAARSDAGGIVWSRRVPSPSAHRDKMIKSWGLEQIADKVPDTLGNLTCGGLLAGDGFAPGSPGTGEHEGRKFQSAALRSVRPLGKFSIRAAIRIAQDPSQEAWDGQVKKLAEASAKSGDADRRKSDAWWQAFWDRSRIVINPDAQSPEDSAWQVGRNYQLFRAMLAADASGRFPSFFNGGPFTCGPNPDKRAWANTKFMAQNQRHLYWPLLRSGDADLLRVGTEFYRRTADLQRARVKLKLGIDGVVYDESIGTLGLGVFPGADGFNKLGHLRYHFASGLEFVLMMIEAHRYFGSDLQPSLPAILGSLEFFDNFYRVQNKTRTGSELNDKGELVIFPGNALELYDNTTNAADALSGLTAISDALIALPAGTLSPDQRAYVAKFRKSLPPLPTRPLRGHTVLAPAKSWNKEGRQPNAELPQLYSVFPFGIYGVGKPDLELARNTWWYGHRDPTQKSAYCWFQGNIFTASLGLTEEARKYALSKFLFPADHGVSYNPWKSPIAPPRTRFPVFWDTPERFCEIPDMDHGGSAMVGLQEMLMQTEGRKIRLFPAWPKDWDVDFKLHAPFQTTVEGKFRKGKIEQLTVTPASRKADVIDLSGATPPPVPDLGGE